MSRNLFEDVKEFHERFGVNYYGKPRALPPDLDEFRDRFLREEMKEYFDARDKLTELLAHRRCTGEQVAKLLEDQLDALVDLVYVALGNAVLQGFDFQLAWERVHTANLRKVRAEKATESKRGSRHDIVKPEGWSPPDHSDLVADNAHNDTLPLFPEEIT